MLAFVSRRGGRAPLLPGTIATGPLRKGSGGGSGSGSSSALGELSLFGRRAVVLRLAGAALLSALALSSTAALTLFVRTSLALLRTGNDDDHDHDHYHHGGLGSGALGLLFVLVRLPLRLVWCLRWGVAISAIFLAAAVASFLALASLLLLVESSWLDGVEWFGNSSPAITATDLVESRSPSASSSAPFAAGAPGLSPRRPLRAPLRPFSG